MRPSKCRVTTGSLILDYAWCIQLANIPVLIFVLTCYFPGALRKEHWVNRLVSPDHVRYTQLHHSDHNNLGVNRLNVIIVCERT